MQGIPWERLHFTRARYREQRVEQYQNYLNLEVDPAALAAEATAVAGGQRLYGFVHNCRRVRSNFMHFQLRNLLWATSKHDVYVMSDNTVTHWCTLTRKLTEVLNVDSRHAATYFQISTMCVRSLPRCRLLAVGGFSGEMVLKRLDAAKPAPHFLRVSREENAITNAIESYDSRSGATCVVSSNNDTHVRVFDAETGARSQCFLLPWAVNFTAVSPDARTFCVVGDDRAVLLMDASSGKIAHTISGHHDYSFAAAWHPNGVQFATGNQDTTTRVWDARYTGQALAVLRGRMGAVRSLRYSSDGSTLVSAEPADFVHVYDVARGGDEWSSQEIDIFGEVAGISLSPDDSTLFVGVADPTYGSLLEFSRVRHHHEVVDDLTL